VPDKGDACPDTPGVPSPDPKKNGCPGLVEVKSGMIVLLQQVFFATDKDVILKKSFPVLDAVADALKRVATIRRVSVEGHTDNKGKPDHNRDLSDRRAKSVMKSRVDKGIDAGRLEAHGDGPDRRQRQGEGSRSEPARELPHHGSAASGECGERHPGSGGTDPRRSAHAQ
jgi:outer membrane protein OmpA-like peptidoglycan-associated protein